MDEELETYKAGLSNKIYISKTKFDAEFDIYRKLSEGFLKCVKAFNILIPQGIVLWNRVVVCYNCNDLKELRELEVLVAKALEDLGDCSGAVDIPNLDEKIKAIEEEITKITETDPYQYKFLLTDADAVTSKKEELKSYEKYSDQLDDALEVILGSGVKIAWQMK